MVQLVEAPTHAFEAEGVRHSERLPQPSGAPWQKDVYQVRISGFQDSNGDGVGDIPGLTDRLGYIKSLGVGTIWLSPPYPSPLVDDGYDVQRYCDIRPDYGTRQDFRALTTEAKSLGMQIVIDNVQNHCSDEFAPFQISRKSSRFEDWFNWAHTSNNWQSFFGGDYFTWDPLKAQYYGRKFHMRQPDFNNRNPRVKKYFDAVERYWIQKQGVAGFRDDVADHKFEDPTFENMRENSDWREGDNLIDKLVWREKILGDYAEVYEEVQRVSELRRAQGAFTIGEINSGDIRHVVNLHNSGMEMPMFMELQYARSAEQFKRTVNQYLLSLPDGTWPNFVLGNHDNPRLIDRVGHKNFRMITTLFNMLPGSHFIYAGDEYGLENASTEVNPDPQFAGGAIMVNRNLGRGHMQWDDSPHAGFTTGVPKTGSGPNEQGQNVAAQDGDPRSILNLNRSLASIRAQYPALRHGNYVPINSAGETVSFARVSVDPHGEDQHVLVTANYSDNHESMKFPNINNRGKILFSSNSQRKVGEIVQGGFEISPQECIVVECVKTR